MNTFLYIICERQLKVIDICLSAPRYNYLEIIALEKFKKWGIIKWTLVPLGQTLLRLLPYSH